MKLWKLSLWTNAIFHNESFTSVKHSNRRSTATLALQLKTISHSVPIHAFNCLLFSRIIKTHEIAHQLDITFLRRIDLMSKHFVKCSMVNAKRNEKQQRCPIQNIKSIDNWNVNTYFARIAHICRLIPRQLNLNRFCFRFVLNISCLTTMKIYS